jgi:hypothetical protein
MSLTGNEMLGIGLFLVPLLAGVVWVVYGSTRPLPRSKNAIPDHVDEAKLTIRSNQLTENAAVMHVVGPMGTDFLEETNVHIQYAATKNLNDIVFDLGKARGMTFQSALAFSAALKYSHPRGGEVFLSNASDEVKGILNGLGFAEYFTFVSTPKHAVELLKKRSIEAPVDPPTNRSERSGQR